MGRVGPYLQHITKLRGEPLSFPERCCPWTDEKSVVEQAGAEPGGRTTDMPEGQYMDWKGDPGPREVAIEVGDHPRSGIETGRTIGSSLMNYV